MKKYILAQGYKFKGSYNDMTHKEFYLVGVVYGNSDTSTMGGFKLDREETYGLFLKDIDVESFKTTLETIIDSALEDGVGASLAHSITVENVENGYNVTMSYNIQG